MKNIALILDRHDVFDSLISFVIKEKKISLRLRPSRRALLNKRTKPQIKKKSCFPESDLDKYRICSKL